MWHPVPRKLAVQRSVRLSAAHHINARGGLRGPTPRSRRGEGRIGGSSGVSRVSPWTGGADPHKCGDQLVKGSPSPGHERRSWCFHGAPCPRFGSNGPQRTAHTAPGHRGEAESIRRSRWRRMRCRRSRLRPARRVNARCRYGTPANWDSTSRPTDHALRPLVGRQQPERHVSAWTRSMRVLPARLSPACQPDHLHRRLSQMQHLRSPTEVQFLRDRQERLHPPNLHNPPYCPKRTTTMR